MVEWFIVRISGWFFLFMAKFVWIQIGIRMSVDQASCIIVDFWWRVWFVTFMGHLHEILTGIHLPLLRGLVQGSTVWTVFILLWGISRDLQETFINLIRSIPCLLQGISIITFIIEKRFRIIFVCTSHHCFLLRELCALIIAGSFLLKLKEILRFLFLFTNSGLMLFVMGIWELKVWVIIITVNLFPSLRCLVYFLHKSAFLLILIWV